MEKKGKERRKRLIKEQAEHVLTVARYKRSRLVHNACQREQKERKRKGERERCIELDSCGFFFFFVAAFNVLAALGAVCRSGSLRLRIRICASFASGLKIAAITIQSRKGRKQKREKRRENSKCHGRGKISALPLSVVEAPQRHFLCSSSPSVWFPSILWHCLRFYFYVSALLLSLLVCQCVSLPVSVSSLCISICVVTLFLRLPVCVFRV